MPRKRAPVQLEGGWITKFEDGTEPGSYTVGIATELTFDDLGSLTRLCRGVEYWGVKLDALTSAALKSAFESGDRITYDPTMMRRLSFHRVPWATFRVNTEAAEVSK